MSLKYKKGITVTSIVVYVILFFSFTTITTIISSRFNQSLFDDRGKAINITALNKLEYNLIKSANDSFNVEVTNSDDLITLNFSNTDEYIFDKQNQIIYKNRGKLVGFVKDYDISVQDNIIEITVTLNKYTNKITRTINLSISTI